VPLDPEVQKMVDRLADQPDVSTMSVAQARAAHKWRWPTSLRVDAIGSVEDISIPGSPSLAARVYKPLGEGPFPLLLFFHGSGFVVSDLDTHDPMCRNFCAGARCIVLSVDYRLAPEAKFPAAVDDCYRAACWAPEFGKSAGALPGVIAVAGDSAGGNLAAVTAQRIRDQGGPKLCGQLLIYPVTDYHTPGTPSYAENATGYLLTRSTMEWFWGHYLSTPQDADNPYASPLRAASLGGLPPAMIQTAQYDPLRDEGELYARRLVDAGVPAKLTRYDGVHHGFFFFPGLIRKAELALEESCGWLRERFGETSVLNSVDCPAA
jgi:acetyl esterase